MQMQMLSPFKGISSECLISFLTTFSYVLHYGPLEGSKDGKAKVLNYLDGMLALMLICTLYRCWPTWMHFQIKPGRSPTKRTPFHWSTRWQTKIQQASIETVIQNITWRVHTTCVHKKSPRSRLPLHTTARTPWPLKTFCSMSIATGTTMQGGSIPWVFTINILIFFNFYHSWSILKCSSLGMSNVW